MLTHPQTWIVIITIPALPKDRAQLLDDIPKHARAYFADEDPDKPRTGIAMRLRVRTAVKAISVAMHTTIDLMVNLQHAPVSGLELHTENDFRDQVAVGTLTSLAAELADENMPCVYEEP